jgi:hypothetical protein
MIDKSHATMHWAFIAFIATSKTSQVITKNIVVKESTKWIVWDCPIMWKAKCFMHHSSQ